jgi:hypothetical protein
MSDENGGRHMARPRFRNDLNWNTVLSVLTIVGVVGGVIGTYTILQYQQKTNTNDISALKDISARQEGRITTLEVNRTADVSRTEDFKKDVLARVDKLTEKISSLAESNAGLAATIRQQERDRR